MLKVKTLIHKAAMPIALESVRTFSLASPKVAELEIHSDGSLAEEDWLALEVATQRLEIVRVEPEDRRLDLERIAETFPLASELLNRAGYMAKLKVLAFAERPFFYFDSDIVWLRTPDFSEFPESRTVFSTETWSWYFGIRNPAFWVRNRIPRRINSGFAWMPEAFPFQRMEEALVKGLYTPDHTFSTDQELLAFLHPEAAVFSLSDFERTRVGVHYDLLLSDAIALHFPGGMWKRHLHAIDAFQPTKESPGRKPQIQPARPLDWPELGRMYAAMAFERNPVLQRGANLFRRLRSRFLTSKK